MYANDGSHTKMCKGGYWGGGNEWVEIISYGTKTIGRTYNNTLYYEVFFLNYLKYDNINPILGWFFDNKTYTDIRFKIMLCHNRVGTLPAVLDYPAEIVIPPVGAFTSITGSWELTTGANTRALNVVSRTDAKNTIDNNYSYMQLNEDNSQLSLSEKYTLENGILTFKDSITFVKRDSVENGLLGSYRLRFFIIIPEEIKSETYLYEAKLMVNQKITSTDIYEEK